MVSDLVGIKMSNGSCRFPHKVMDGIKIICAKHNCNEMMEDDIFLGTLSTFYPLRQMERIR